MLFPAKSESLRIGSREYAFVQAAESFGARFNHLPHVLRILFENVVRFRSAPSEDPATAFRKWLEVGTSSEEIEFRPCRLLMHDTTCVPALVDIAAMRDALARGGEDPFLLNPTLAVDVSVDHSVAVDEYGSRNALAHNMGR